MAMSKNLKRMIDANAPLWAGEAEIIETYWTSTVRSRETDMLWLRRQCWKEYGGIGDSKGKTKGMVGDLIPRLEDEVPRLDISVDRHDLLDHLSKVCVEYNHYCLFADIHDSLLEGDETSIIAGDLAPWPEEEALASRRRTVNVSHGDLGHRATDFTEGGYCTMYSEGAKLQGRDGVDGQIGTACQKVYDDEFGHMMHGVVGVDDEGLSQADWDQLLELTMEQLRLRIPMRNEQFSHPLSDQRVGEILNGDIDPIQFDFAKAETYL